MAVRYAVKATALFFGDIVEETVVEPGHEVRLGRTHDLAVPLPPGADHLAHVTWSRSGEPALFDADGTAVPLSEGAPASIAHGPVRIDFELVPRFALRRSSVMWWLGATGWLVAVFALQVGLGQYSVVSNRACGWAEAVTPATGRILDPSQPDDWLLREAKQFLRCEAPRPAPPPGGDGGGAAGADRMAEYLQRLLKEDYEGEDSEQGYVAKKEADPVEKKSEESRAFLPAGSQGPADRMGGASSISSKPNRVPEPEAAKPKPAAKPEPPKLAVRDTEAEPAAPAAAPADDASDEIVSEESFDTPPSDEEQGWGVPDWYDDDDARRETSEIEMMMEIANLRLRIDPNDEYALSILSYYQYLAMDFESAEETYDKLIEMDPEDAAWYNNKALIYKRTKKYKEEEELYELALTLDPNDETALNNLAVCLSHQGRYAEALAIMDRLLLIDPDDPYAHLHRSKIHAEMGNDTLALSWLERALEGMRRLDTLHHIEFRQDIRVDPSFARLRKTARFRSVLWRYYGEDTPLDH